MNFYEKPLSEFSDEEWEQICMKCGKCCMCKFSENDVVHFSNQMCKFFDIQKGECSCYSTRFDVAKGECQKVSMELLENDLGLLPPSCAYRRLYEGRGLPSYHPLITKNPKSVIDAGQTVKSLPVFSENAQGDAVQSLLKTAFQQHWSEVKIMYKVSRICKRYSLKLLETYPLPTCVEKSAT